MDLMPDQDQDLMDEDLIRPHRGFLHVDNAKNLGAAMAIDSNCFHANDL